MTTATGAGEEPDPWPPGLAAEVARAVEALAPGDGREEASRRRVLTGLHTLPRPFSEAAGSEHVTASAIVVGPRGTVLHLHKRIGRWLQPGGHVEPGEDPAAAARREAEEETGIPADHPPGGPQLVHVDAHDAARGHVHLDLRYLLTAPDVDPRPGPGESPHARWYPWAEAEAVADDALAGALRRARAVAQTLYPGGDDTRRERGEASVADRFTTLLELQDHDTTLDQLHHRRAALPERAELAELTSVGAALDARTSTLRVQRDELEVRQGLLEEQIDQSRRRLAELEKRMYGGQIAAARDLQAMDDEVRHLRRHIAELEDREIEVMEEIEPLDGDLQAADIERDVLDNRTAVLRGELAEAEKVIDAELAVHEAARRATAADVPDDLLARYEQLRRKLGGTGAARLVGGSCGGCHLALPAMEVDRIRKAPPDTVITCDQCGRILVR